MSIVAVFLVTVASGVLYYMHSQEVGKAVRTALVVGVLFTCALGLIESLTVVNAGTVGVVTRYGAVNRTLEPGLHAVWPYVETVNTVNTQTMIIKTSEEASSHDLQQVHMETTLAYHFDPAYAGWIFQQLIDQGSNAVENKAVIPSLLEAMKSTTAHYDAQELIDKRPLVRDGVEAFITSRLKPYHIVPESVSITNFNFSQDYNNAIEAKVTAAQQAEKAQNDLARIKIEAEQKVAEAQGQAQARLAVAGAEAEANRKISESLTDKLVQYETIKRWNGATPQFEGSSNLLFTTPLKH